MEGSSPLARGLRLGCTLSDGGQRIIPARAGFTWGPVPRWRPSADHPRSRGVYNSGNWDEKNEDGSSPLARGLHL